jgi:hypothetical protein
VAGQGVGLKLVPKLLHNFRHLALTLSPFEAEREFYFDSMGLSPNAVVMISGLGG